ncbi:MAG: hypothetical protein J1F42_00900 [Lachnospiraceae bacterium]|nr:hypothetical protein [Lachnospiraceae bacterium]
MKKADLYRTYTELKDICRKYESMIVLIVSAIVIGGVLFGTGNILTGWHWVDDHEMYRILKLYKNRHVSLTETISLFLKNDFNIRWRPLYWILRVVMCYIFGDSPVIYKLILCVIGMAVYVLLYRSARNLQCSAWFSHLFALVVLMGRQFEVWYRIANQENIGMLFGAVCIYLLTKQYKDNVFSRKTDIVIVVMACCSGLMKESFLLLLPAVVWLRLGLEAARNLQSPKDILNILKRNILFIIIPAAFFLINIYVIVSYVGVNQIGYAGLDESYGIKEYIWAMLRLCKDSLFSYVLLACIILGITLLWLGFVFLTKKEKLHINFLLLVLIIFGGCIVVTQMILHAKSGMWNRYLLPGVIGFAILFVVCTDLLLENVRYKIAIGFIIGIFLISRFKLSIINMSLDYAQEAKAINQVYDIVLDRTDADSRIVNAFSDIEADGSFGVFMELQGRPHVYKYDYEKKQVADVFGEYIGESIRLDEADVLVLWGGVENEEESDALLQSLGNWDKINVMEIYNVYIKK